MIKKLSSLFLCLALVCAATGALADDAALRDALAAGKTLVLTRADLPGNPENGMPCSLSPDGRTILWRKGLDFVLTRNGTEIPVHAAPERGSGDPYGQLEETLVRLSGNFPGFEGVSWSPDGKFFIFSSAYPILNRVDAADLILVDTENGEAFAVQTWDHNWQSDGYGTVIEAHFDASGENIWFLGIIRALAAKSSLFRYILAENRTELILEDIPILTGTQTLYQAADGGWLVITDSEQAGSRDARDVFLRYTPSTGSLSAAPGGGTVDRSERSFPSYLLKAAKGVCSPVTGYGLSLVFMTETSSTASQMSMEMQMQYIALKAVYDTRRLNQITPEGIDLNRYWELAGDPADPASMHLTETDPALIDLMTRDAAHTPDEGDYDRMLEIGRALLEDNMPTLSCLCMSPGGNYAVLTAYTLNRETMEREPSWWLVDPASMTLYPVEIPDALGPDYFGTAFGAVYRPAIEWTGDILLVYNDNGSTVEAYRLEAME